MFGWLGLSAICQIPCGFTRRLRVMDLAGLVPHWTFFAPTPGTCDYYLLYRDDQLLDSSLTAWREISLCDNRRPWHLLWNPRKREKKALFDLTTALLREVQLEHLETIQLSVPYLALLTYVSSLPRQYPVQALSPDPIPVHTVRPV